MRRYLESHMKSLKCIYYFLVIVFFAEIIFFCYFYMKNERTVKYLEGIIHYDGNHSISFDTNEVVVDLNETRRKVIYVDDNSTSSKTKKTRTKIIKSTVYRFEYDKSYSKLCDSGPNLICANSKKIFGYSGDSLYLDKVYVSGDGNTILGLFEHNIFAYKHSYEKFEKCEDKLFGKYELQNNKIVLHVMSHAVCNSCLKIEKLDDYSLDISNNVIKDIINSNELKLLTQYNDYVVSIAYEMGYFDGNVVCSDVYNKIKE